MLIFLLDYSVLLSMRNMLVFSILLIISIGLTPSIFAENFDQILPTDQGTINVGLSVIPTSEPHSTSELHIGWINPTSNNIQEHIDYSVTVTNNGMNIFGPIPLTHTSTGIVNIPIQFASAGQYSVKIHTEGILFQPIPPEIIIFSVNVGNNSSPTLSESDCLALAQQKAMNNDEHIVCGFPFDITVVDGERITWIETKEWTGTYYHTITSVDGFFDFTDMGATSFLPSAWNGTGVYNYYDKLNPSLTGTITVIPSTPTYPLTINSLNVYQEDNQVRYHVTGDAPPSTNLTFQTIMPNGNDGGTSSSSTGNPEYNHDGLIFNPISGDGWIMRICSPSECIEQNFEISPSFPSIELSGIIVEDGWSGDDISECGYLHNGEMYYGIVPSSSAIYVCPTDVTVNLDDLTTGVINIQTFIKTLVNIVQPFEYEIQVAESNGTLIFTDVLSSQTSNYANNGNDYEIKWSPENTGTYTTTISVKSPNGILLANSETLNITVTSNIGPPTNSTSTTESQPEPQPETDSVAPEVLVPNDIVLQATSQSGAVASFNPQAIDNIDELLTPSCNYSSGSVFPVGTTVVTCTAVDSSGNSNSKSFSVIVNYTDYSVPDWVKNVAGFWNQGDINDESFLEGISYLIQNNIIIVPETEATVQTESTVPSWVKTNAGWWASGDINDETFVNGIQYLIQIGLIQV